MSTSELELPPLSAEQKRWLESFLRKFEDGWAEGLLAQRARELPPPTSPLRRPLLAALARIDLAKQWQQGRRAAVEAYLKLYPELGDAATAPFALVLEEYQQRLAGGAPADLDQFARRFPAHAERLRQLHEQPTSHGPSFGPTLTAAPATPTAVSPAATGELPERFGRYRIEKQLGAGGMGAVYLALDTQLDRFVALKVPRFAGGASPEALERFNREARAAATLSHPNICPVYDVNTEGGVPYVTMAYVEGRPLSELIRAAGGLPQRPAADLVRKIALALEEAHRKGVIHRDLKPANVMINEANEPVVMDFGLAHRAGKDEDARLTREGATMGTPAYMPPEQASGDLKAIGPRSDVYGLGVILFELLTGRLPFQGPPAAVLAQVLTQEPPRPSSLRPDLDAGLEAACLKALAKTPADRFPSMKEFAAALEHYLQGRPAAAVAPVAAVVSGVSPVEGTGSAVSGATELPGRLAARPEADPTLVQAAPAGRRRKLLQAGAALLLAAGVLVLALVLFKKSDPAGPGGPGGPGGDGEDRRGGGERDAGGKDVGVRPRPVVPVDPPDEEVGELTVFTGHDGSVRALAYHPDGRRLFSTDEAVPGPGKIRTWVREKRQPVGAFVATMKGAYRPYATALAVSGDGHRLLSGWTISLGLGPTFHGVVLADPDSGKQLCTSAGGHSRSVRWVGFLPGGKRGFSSADDDVTYIWDLETGKEIDRLPGRAACASPDGRLLALASSSPGGAHVIWLWRVGTPSRRTSTSFKGRGGVNQMTFTPDSKGLLAATGDGTLHLWDVNARSEIRVFKGHPGPVLCVAVAQDGRRAASGGWDKTVRIWDLATGKEVHKFEGHTDAVNAVAFSPGGRRVLSGSSDKTSRLWQLPPK